MNRDYCLRCGQAGHCSEDCPRGMSKIATSFFAFILRTAVVLTIFFFLVGTVDYCADSYANDVPTFGSSK